MASDPLSVESILQHMADALPPHPKDDPNSDLSSSYEAIGLFAHACMAAVGFRLLGFSEGQKIEPECRRLAPRLPPQWNSAFGSHSFLYAHPQSSMQYVIKVDRLGGKAELRGIGLGDEKITRFEITAKDFVSSSALPLRIPVEESGEEDRSNLKLKLKDMFISEARIKDLASLFKIAIIQNLMPNLHKEGYEQVTEEAGVSERESERERERVREMREDELARRGQPAPNPLRQDPIPPLARPYPFDDPLAAAPRRPVVDFPPPGFEDEYEINRPRGDGYLPRGSPFNIGHDDLNPPGLGPNDLFRGSGGLPRPGGMGGGMHPTFDDPLFGGRGGQGSRYDPQAPPGARYDPVSPGMGAPRGSNDRFPGGRGGSGGWPPNPFGSFGENDFI